MLQFLFFLSFSAALAAEPEEVAELKSVPLAEVSATEPATWYEYRGYLVSELGWLSQPRVVGLERGSAIGEANATAIVRPTSWLSLFGDGLWVGSLPGSASQAVLAQAGLRIQAAEEWSLALGRERNFRAPGMLVNPSDFLHPSQTVPGQRMQRAGVWLARASYQTLKFTADGLFLPFQDLDAGGIPLSAKAEDLGGAGRVYVSAWDTDLGLTAGYFGRTWQGGLSVSRYVLKGFEIHTELGYRSGSGGRALLGTRLDVGSSSSVTLEGYYNGWGYSSDSWDRVSPGLLFAARKAAAASSSSFSGSATSQLNLFHRQWYLIGGYSASDLWKIFNASFSAVLSAEDYSGLSVFRWEWMVSGRSTLSLLALGLWGRDDGQYGARPIDSRLGIEWRLNF